MLRVLRDYLRRNHSIEVLSQRIRKRREMIRDAAVVIAGNDLFREVGAHAIPERSGTVDGAQVDQPDV